MERSIEKALTQVHTHKSGWIEKVWILGSIQNELEQRFCVETDEEKKKIMAGDIELVKAFKKHAIGKSL